MKLFISILSISLSLFACKNAQPTSGQVVPVSEGIAGIVQRLEAFDLIGHLDSNVNLLENKKHKITLSFDDNLRTGEGISFRQYSKSKSGCANYVNLSYSYEENILSNGQILFADIKNECDWDRAEVQIWDFTKNKERVIFQDTLKIICLDKRLKEANKNQIKAIKLKIEKQ